ncbi:F-box only protein 48 [Chionomys nivalis]|uniref:F-box only protein 48 n=1 Tax=Chionomys nivalis TaxID=269649 RepID=UPI002594001C|nr:F-box only protein 48 [Chionomys nivalis]
MDAADAQQARTASHSSFVDLLPPEVTCKIFSQLDVQSLCRASETCWSWNRTIINNDDALWKPHCLTARAVCPREIDRDIEHNTWRETLLRNYQKSKVKHAWLSGRYSNIRSPLNLPKRFMYPMDVDTWGEILDAELKR